LAGATIAIVSVGCIVFLLFAEFFAAHSNPYIGIFTYMLLPGVMIFGLAVMFVGALIERRKRRRLTPEEIGAYPLIGFNDPRRRRRALVFAGVTSVFLFASAFGSYR